MMQCIKLFMAELHNTLCFIIFFLVQQQLTWTTQVWSAWVHLYSTIQSKIGWIQGCTAADTKEPGIRRNCGYKGPTVKFQANFFTGQEVSAPDYHTVQGSTLFVFSELIIASFLHLYSTCLSLIHPQSLQQSYKCLSTWTTINQAIHFPLGKTFLKPTIILSTLRWLLHKAETKQLSWDFTPSPSTYLSLCFSPWISIYVITCIFLLPWCTPLF